MPFEQEKDNRLFRTLVLASTVALGLLIWFATATKASAVSLRQESVIETDMITLGDVFYGLRHNEDRVLGPAPRPGQKMVLNARTLMRIALALDVQWRPASSAEYVVLRRAATIVGPDLIKDLLREGLREKGLNSAFDMLLDQDAPQIILPKGERATAEITHLTLDRDRNTFEAVLVAPSQHKPLRHIRLAGTLQKLVSVPVLREPLQKGAIIREHHIMEVQIPEKRVQHNAILDKSELIGTTPRRMAQADRPLTLDDVEPPQIVRRGETINMFLSEGALRLSAQARALESGARGDIIRVVNTTSNRTVEARVSGAGEVTVASF